MRAAATHCKLARSVPYFAAAIFRLTSSSQFTTTCSAQRPLDEQLGEIAAAINDAEEQDNVVVNAEEHAIGSDQQFAKTP